jgi:hypothetical protein
LAATYVEDDQQSYRKTASPEGRVRTYDAGSSERPRETRGLFDHTTIWRILTWLGCQLPALHAGRHQLQQQNPASTCHRFVGAVAPCKFRSPQRERVLRQSRQLLQLIDEWDALFPEKFFPRFATRSGFG